MPAEPGQGADSEPAGERPDAPATLPHDALTETGVPPGAAAGGGTAAGVDDDAPEARGAAGDAQAVPGVHVSPRRPTTSLEGRAAPGLYAVGWLLPFVGLALLLIGFSATEQGAVAVYGLVGGGALILALGLVAAAGAQALQGRADGVSPYSGPRPLLVFGAVFAFNVPIALVIAAAGLLDEGREPLGTFTAVVATAALNVGLVHLLVAGTGALTWAEMGLRRPQTARDPATLVRDVLAGVLLAPPAFLAVAVVAMIAVGLLGVTPESTIPTSSSPVGVLVTVLTAVLVAPISEEIFYRGFVTTAWARRYGAASAIIRGAIFFSFVHILSVGGSDADTALRAAAVAFLARLPISYALGWLFLRRASLWAAIALHVAYNGLLVTLALLASRVVPA